MTDWFLALPMPLLWLIVICMGVGYLCDKALPPLLDWWKYHDFRSGRGPVAPSDE